MTQWNKSKAPRSWCFLLAGLEAGMVASWALLAWLAFTSLWQNRSVWTVPNLLASTFFGESALRGSFGAKTLAGMALHLMVYSLVGAVFGLTIRDHGNRLRIVLLGALSGLAWYYLFFGLLWKILNPMILLYSPDRPLLLGHLLYGSLLGRFPVYLRSVKEALTL